ncbi:hypothetical protein B0H17DRAFT_664980 [Mycena rosella]|uniref:Uncharacterized protein n=1 Tax=Mycena rosella TaxID=1033263 RepID=A0AAD7M7Y3_MYCRO|nr:hypothetical protein B0H17DRAFT_664980 [Mycena rosella]
MIPGASITRATLSWLDSEARNPSASLKTQAFALAMYHIIIIVDGRRGDTIVVQHLETSVLGELVEAPIKISRDSNRIRTSNFDITSLYPRRNRTNGTGPARVSIYTTAPRDGRGSLFVLFRVAGGLCWHRCTSTINLTLGDGVFLSCLENWVEVVSYKQTLQHFSLVPRVFDRTGFQLVHRRQVPASRPSPRMCHRGHHISFPRRSPRRGGRVPRALPALSFFGSDRRDADVDRAQKTVRCEILKLKDPESSRVLKDVEFLDRKQFAVLEELRTLAGSAFPKDSLPSPPLDPWSDGRHPSSESRKR